MGSIMTTAVPDYRTGRTRSGDVEIFFRLFGEPRRTPVIILHGLSYFSYDWVRVGQELAQDRQVAAMDMRGFGDSSSSPTQDYSLAAFARDVLAVADESGWSSFVLIGHSMGGRNAAYCAVEHPAPVRGLVLVDYSPTNAPEGARRVAETVGGAPELFASVEAAMHYFGNDPHSPQGAEMRVRMEAYLRPVDGGYSVKRDPYFREHFRRIIETGERPKLPVDMWQAVARISCPTLLARGTRSDMLTGESAQKMAKANSRLQVSEIESGHNVPGEKPEELVAHVRQFFERNDL
jgi:esterase